MELNINGEKYFVEQFSNMNRTYHDKDFELSDSEKMPRSISVP